MIPACTQSVMTNFRMTVETEEKNPPPPPGGVNGATKLNSKLNKNFP
jgi:hypothetical protein